MLRRKNNAEGNIDNDMIGKSIYIFSYIRYIKTKTYRRYNYIYQ